MLPSSTLPECGAGAVDVLYVRGKRRRLNPHSAYLIQKLREGGVHDPEQISGLIGMAQERFMTATPGEIGELAAKSHEKFFPIGGRVRCLTCSGKLTTIPCVYCTNRKDSPVYEFLEAMKRGKERCEDRDAADAELGC